MCREGFIAYYEKAIASWEPRRKAFRVIEALDLSRLPEPPTRDASKSRFFMDFAVPFPQAELFASSVRTPSTAMRGPLATIGEEATPEPETPSCSPLAPQLSPRSRKPLLSSSSNMQVVHDSLSQLELGAQTVLSEASTDIEMRDNHQDDENETYDLDLDAPAPVRAPPPKMRLPYRTGSEDMEQIPETPLQPWKRTRDVDAELEDVYEGLLGGLADRFTAGPSFSKKMRLLR